MPNKIDLSIIIPVYNAEKYLKTCLDSILNQTYKYIEVICVNDCSKDNSLKILEEYALKDERVQIVNNATNLGPGANRNIGIKRARGKYLTFIDADDFYLHNECFSALLNKMTDNDLDLLIFNNKEFDEETLEFIPEKQKRFGYPYSKKDINHIWDKKELKKHYFRISAFPWSKIYLKEMLTENKILFPEGIYYEDAAFSNYVSLFCKKVYVLKEDYYAYRVNVSTSTTQNIMAKFDSIAAMHIEMLNFLKERNLYETYLIPFVILCIESLCLYFLPQINEIAKARELNSQIVDFINTLNLSNKELNKIRKENYYVADIINKYRKYYKENILEEKTITIFKIPILKYTSFVKYKQLYLFNILPIYKIFYKRADRSIHYLFNIIPWLKVKSAKAYLFMLLPIIKFENYKFYTKNFEYILYENKTRNQ